MADGISLLVVVPVIVVVAAGVGIVKGAIHVHDKHGEAIRQRIQRAWVRFISKKKKRKEKKKKHIHA